MSWISYKPIVIYTSKSFKVSYMIMKKFSKKHTIVITISLLGGSDKTSFYVSSNILDHVIINEIIYNDELSDIYAIQNGSKSWIYGFETV